tara:strand:- start:22136 stop:26197 length:4062 start_codon:yes stop_codon:yes gene_type:complete
MISNRFLYVLSFVFLPILLLGQNKSDSFAPNFTNIALEEGLSNYHITSICQDSLGYVWIGTGRGLNRYDGTSFKHYFFTPDTPKFGIPHDYINKTIYSNNHVFVNTRRGAVVLNQKSDTWNSLVLESNIADITAIQNRVFAISKNTIFEYDFELSKLKISGIFSPIKAVSFIKSDANFLWILSNDRKTIYRCNLKSNLLVQIHIDDPSFSEILAASIVNNQIIANTNNGIYALQLSENKDAVDKQSTLLHSAIDNPYFSVEQYDNQTALVSSGAIGLNSYDTHTGVWRHIEKSNSQLSTDLINTIFKDRDGNLWIGTFNKGLDVHYKKQSSFNTNAHLNKIIGNEFINSIVNNPYKNELILATRSKGVLSSREGGKITINEKLKRLGLTNITDLFVDSQNKLWIAGFSGNGTLIYDQTKETIIKLENYQQLGHIGHISEINGEIYLVSKIRGIYIYSLDGKFKRHITTSVTGLNQIVPLEKDILLISEESGLYLYKKDTGEITSVPLYENGRILEWDGAVCIKQESDAIVWIGTLSWGLIKMNLNNFEGKMYTTADGLPCNDVTAIEIDENGYKWLSTSYGISCMYEEGKFYNFSSYEGIGNFQFHRRSSFYSEDGMIYFGGNDGLSYFDPKEVVINKKMEKKPILERLNVQNNEVQNKDETKILNRTLPFTGQIVLPHYYSDFSIGYTSTEFLAHDQIQYAYRLKGWDDAWRNVNNRQNASYSNLPPGTFNFEVKSKRAAGIWSEVSELSIRIKPAPWKTWWAFLIYISIFAGLTYLIFSLRFRNKMVRKNLEIEQNEHSRENEMNEMKLKFFTNISHELRTPLSMIYDTTSVDKNELKSNKGLAQFLSNIKINIGRLKRLVDQLLTFRELENDTLKVEPQSTNLQRTLTNIISTIKFNAKQRNIKLFFEYNLSKERYLVDGDKVEKILYNVLDNALKYTGGDGSIIINIDQIPGKELQNTFESPESINKEQDFILFEIADNGVGISESDLPHIFERYFKASNKTDYSGTGIGLNFVKRLVELQDGFIKAESKEGSGTTFFIALPLVEAIDAIEDEKAGEEEQVLSNDTPTFPSVYVTVPEELYEKKILIVEDDIALNTYLKNSLEKHFKVYTVFNSEEALRIVKNVFPDLIISDVMMREEDEGLKFCETIKNDSLLSHIPVILLTAKAEETHIDEGLMKGADIYVTKPFSLQLLTSQIVSLLKNRLRLQQHLFKNELSEETVKTDYNTQDLSFIKKVNSIIEMEYKNPKFNVIELSKELAINRTGFYQKFNQITQLSPSEYLRKYRIGKAVELFSENNKSVSTIGDEVGFSSRSGFFSAFKKEKGMTPSEFMKSKNNRYTRFNSDNEYLTT